VRYSGCTIRGTWLQLNIYFHSIPPAILVPVLRFILSEDLPVPLHVGFYFQGKGWEDPMGAGDGGTTTTFSAAQLLGIPTCPGTDTPLASRAGEGCILLTEGGTWVTWLPFSRQSTFLGFPPAYAPRKPNTILYLGSTRSQAAFSLPPQRILLAIRTHVKLAFLTFP
jgi:hypothetical protein